MHHDMFSENDKSRWSKLLDRLQDEQPREEEDVEDCAFLEAAPNVERLMTWGILNPFGPTVESLCLATDPSGKAKVIFVKTSNPLENSTDALGTVNADVPHDDLIRAVIDSTTGGPGSSSRIFQSEPTFVIPSTGDEERFVASAHRCECNSIRHPSDVYSTPIARTESDSLFSRTTNSQRSLNLKELRANHCAS
jgi:hypothetical protein